MNREDHQAKLLSLIPQFKQAIDNKNIEFIGYFDTYFNELKSIDVVNDDFIRENQEEFRLLYQYYRLSEQLVQSISGEVQAEINDLKRKQRVSKKYTEMRKL